MNNMNDLDSLLSIIENPTRRKILQAVVREPHYPLQLSKELGISQQAVVKNLNLMEKEGLLVSYRRSSDRGPERIFYKPSSEFTIIIDMRDNMFEMNMIPATPKTGKPPERALSAETRTDEEKQLDEVRAKIAGIDRQVAEFDRRRSDMIRERNELINQFLDDTDLSNVDYAHRNLLYEMLDRPNWNASEISQDLGFNENTVTQMIDDILAFCQGTHKRM
ncbi:MAG: helix-turn-helix domain-containing protein [Methanomethylophilus sp.]